MATIITQVDGAGALNGTADDDIIVAQHLNGAGVPNPQVLTGGDGNDVIFGDHDEVFLDLVGDVGNSTFATAINIDDPQHWSQRENPDVENSTSVPYTTVLAQGDGNEDFFSVTVGDGETITIDLDYGHANNGNGSFDSVITLFDSSGVQVAFNDDSGNANGGFGSSSVVNRDSFLTFTNNGTVDAVYTINVRDFFGSIPVGATYMLNVSVTNHPQTNFATFGADDIDGGAGNDVLYGGEGDDTINGGADDDLIEGGFGADTMDGGAGIDTLSYSTSEAAVTVELRVGASPTTNGLSHATGDTFSNFENIIGSRFNDFLGGDNNANIIDGGEGADRVTYFFDDAALNVDLEAGTISGGSQATGDTLVSIEKVSGTNGFNDTLRGDDADNTLIGDGGNDTLEGRGGADLLQGGAGRDTATYAGSDAAVQISLIADTAAGGHADGDNLDDIENVFGSQFDDTLTGDNNDNTLRGENGDDTLTGNDGSDAIVGGEGNDTLDGGAGFDNLFGNAGDDLLNGGDDDDTLDGGDGVDTLNGDDGNDILDGGTGSDTLNGGAGDDILSDGSGADTVDGGAGNDTFRLRAGLSDLENRLDTVDGGSDTDTFKVIGAYNQLATFDMAAGTYNIFGADRSVQNFENFDASGLVAGRVDTFEVTGTSGANTIIGGYNDDVLVGGDGGDTLIGGDGDDILIDGGGSDTVEGGAGNDIFRLDPSTGSFSSIFDSFDGGTGTDTFEHSGDFAGTSVFDMEAGTFMVQGFTLSVTNMENFDGSGQVASSADDIRGTSGDNIITTSSASDDTIEGRAGADTLDGGAGGSDTLSYESSDESVAVNLDANIASGGHADGDDISNFENVIGSAFDDNLIGSNDDNVLTGGAGNDGMRGLGGRDEFYGGAGNDSFATGNLASHVVAGEVYDGGADRDSITIEVIGTPRTVDLRDATLTSVEQLLFRSDSGAFIGDLAAQLTVSQVILSGLDTIGVSGRAAGDSFDAQFFMDDATSVDLSGLTFIGNFGGTGTGDTVTIIGDGQNENVIGTSGVDENVALNGGADVYTIRGGLDDVDMGGGFDITVHDDASGPLTAGSIYDGGAGTSDIFVAAATGITDLTDVAVINYERLEFRALADTLRVVDVTDTQILGFDVIDGNEFNNGVDNLDISVTSSGDVDFSGLAFQDWGTGSGNQFDLVVIRDDNATGQTITGTSQSDFFFDDSDLTSGSIDTLIGGAGNDTFVQEDFSFLDNIDGGADFDTVTYSGISTAVFGVGVIVDLAAETTTYGISTEALTNIEGVRGTQLDDTISNSSVFNLISGNDGDDTLIDNFDLSVFDEWDGGDGSDTLVATAVQWGPNVMFDLMDGVQRFGSGFTQTSDTYFDIENVTVNGAAQIRGDNGNNVLTAITGPGAGGAGSFDNIINGEGGNDTILAGEGDDVISGGSGSDDLFGEAGDDILKGDTGNDLIDGGAGNDTASYVDATGRVVVFLDGTPANVRGGQGTDTLVSIENLIGSDFDDRLVGNADDNVLTGGAGDDVLIGLDGNDTLYGGAGNDSLTGSGGDDLLYGGDGNDFFDGLGGADTIFGGAGEDTIFTGNEVDTIDGGAGDDNIQASAGEDVVFGGSGNDLINAGSSSDVVDGGSGNDRIIGNIGQDTLFGGTGNDVLIGGTASLLGDNKRDIFEFKSFANGGGGFDRILDFENGRDKLGLAESGYTNFADVLADASNVGSSMHINFDFGGIVVIEDFQLADFNASDVLF